jgi:glycosyltransferase involved in cell wall biosynthesis
MAGNRSTITLFHVTNVPEQLRCFLGGQVRYMKAQGLEVHVASSQGALLEVFASDENIPAHEVPMTRRIAPLRDLRSVLALWRKIRQVSPHIVHAHSPKGGLLAMLAARLAKVPVCIYHIRGLPFMTAHGLKRRLLKWTERISCTLAHEVFCVSHSMRQIAIAEGFAPTDKIKVFGQGSGNGVDATDRFHPEFVMSEEREQVRQRYGIPPEAILLGFVGRVGNDKGLKELVEAWLTLRDELPSLRLLIVGPLESKDPVPSQVEYILRTDERIHRAGVDWNTRPLYAAMDIVVLPSYREGLPNVPLEAAAMQRPVVATRIPGCTDAVEDGVTGLLVPARDAPSLAWAIRTYAMDAWLRHRHGLAGRKRVLRDFRPQAIWEATWKSYQRLCLSKHLSWELDKTTEQPQKKAA